MTHVPASSSEPVLKSESVPKSETEPTHSDELEQPSGLGLQHLLSLKSSTDLRALAQRLGVGLDSNKRIGEAAQLARGLLALPAARDPSGLPEGERDLIRELLLTGGRLRVAHLSKAASALQDKGLVWIYAEGGEARNLVLPVAYLMQMASWEGEDPRLLRALLVQTSDEARANVCAYHLGRTAVRPFALALESAWLQLTDENWVRQTLLGLPANERQVLLAIEAVGGEVDTEELLALEREPLRLRGAAGATQARRGVGYALERRGFLIPLHPSRHVVPLHVARILGERRALERDRKRSAITRWVNEGHLPDRAQASSDPTPLVLGMALQVGALELALRPDVAVPKSALQRLAQSLGAEVEDIALLAALSRSLQLWHDTANADWELGPEFAVAELGVRLFERWRRGGVWDELRVEPEVLRGVASAFEPAAVNVVRELVLEALRVLGEGTWVPWRAVSEYVCSDTRAAGICRLLERWSARTGCKVVSLEAACQRVALGSLRVLGVVDVGLETESGGGESTRPIRITALGRALVSGYSPVARERSYFTDEGNLRVGAATPVEQVLRLGAWVEVTRTQGWLEVTFSQRRFAQYLVNGGDAASALESFAKLAPAPDKLVQVIREAATARGAGELVLASGFLWVQDPDLREQLRVHPKLGSLFLERSPEGGLLVADGVSPARLMSQCAGAGVRVEWQAGQLRRPTGSRPKKRVVGPG